MGYFESGWFSSVSQKQHIYMSINVTSFSTSRNFPALLLFSTFCPEYFHIFRVFIFCSSKIHEELRNNRTRLFSYTKLKIIPHHSVLLKIYKKIQFNLYWNYVCHFNRSGRIGRNIIFASFASWIYPRCIPSIPSNKNILILHWLIIKSHILVLKTRYFVQYGCTV